MRALLVSGTVADHDLARGLASADRTIEVARDGRAALAFMAKERFDVAVIDWGLTGPTAQDLVRAIRTSELDSHTYIIAMMSSPTGLAVGSAFQSGVDDIIRRPLVREEMLGRIGALDRIKRWAAKVMAGKVLDWSGGTDFTAMRAWKEAESAIGGDLGSVIGRELGKAPGVHAPTAGVGAEIPLTLASEGVDVSLLVSVGQASLAPLSEIVFGQVMDAEALKDVLRELANTAGGAFKRAAETEGVVLTTGLPTDVDPARVHATPGAVMREFTLRATDAPAEIHCRLCVRSRELERLTPNKLSEGMVVARDLLGDNGALLVRSGTRLTEATVRKLSQLLRPTAVVEIARAA